jgi:hypothetical protein
LAKKSIHVLLAPIAEAKMTLSMRRIVLFTKDMPRMTAFYRDVLGRGATMSKVMTGGGLVRCEGKDPDGNPFSISDRP